MEEGRASETLRRRCGASATVMDAERLLSRGLPARSVRRSLGMVRKSFPGFSARRRRERASEATEARRTLALVTEMQWVFAGGRWGGGAVGGVGAGGVGARVGGGAGVARGEEENGLRELEGEPERRGRGGGLRRRHVEKDGRKRVWR